VLEDAKEEIRSRKSKKERIRTKEQTMISKTLHRKLKIEQHNPHLKSGMGSSCSISGTHHVTGCETTIDAYYSFILHA
jgi:hypothetical protein